MVNLPIPFVFAANSTDRGLWGPPAREKAPATLHHFIDGSFVSGSNPWPVDVEENRIGKESGLSWDDLKKAMKGSRA